MNLTVPNRTSKYFASYFRGIAIPWIVMLYYSGCHNRSSGIKAPNEVLSQMITGWNIDREQYGTL